jgi:CBS domain-containing protein
MKRSILTEKLARRGHHITREYSIDLAAMARVRDIMCRSVDTLSAAMTVGEAIDFFLKPDHHHRAYPVIDRSRTVVGLVSRADILSWIGNNHPRGDLLSDALSRASPPMAGPNETISAVTVRMMANGTPRIVVADPETGELLGIVSRGDLIKLRWREFEAESVRTAHLRPTGQGWTSRPKRRTETEPLGAQD